MAQELNNPTWLKAVHRLPCSECDNTTRHQVLACATENQSSDDGRYYWESYEIVACLGCETVSFRKNWRSSDEDDVDENGEVYPANHPELFPPRRAGRKRLKRVENLPSSVRNIYHEVHSAISNNQRVLAGIGIRALVEAVCAQKRAVGGNLEKKIDDLAARNVLTTSAAVTLHRTRLLGNAAAHEVARPNEEQLEAAMDIAEQLLMNVYILPKIGDRLRPVRSRKKRKGSWKRMVSKEEGDDERTPEMAANRRSAADIPRK